VLHIDVGIAAIILTNQFILCIYTVSQKTFPTFSTVTWKPIIRFW